MSALEADRARVAALAAQIEHLERSLSALRTEKALAEKRIDAYKYPVLTLPNEITSEIFVHFLPVYPRFPPLTGILSPTLLTQICRRWREIALGTPALWRAIVLLDEPDDIPPEHQADISHVWLSRSGRCPLSISLDENYDGNAVHLLAVVVPHRERWEYLKLRVSSSLPPTIAGPMPLLHHLDFKVREFVGTNAVLLELPLLRTAILNDIAASLVVLPWAQLTSLTLKRVLPQEWIPILRQTSNLVDCSLRIFPVYGQSYEIPDITLLHLKSLTLEAIDSDATGLVGCLNTFIVPALRSLQIPEEILGESPIDALASFMSKSDCKLEAVCITGETISIPKDSYLRAFPTISLVSLQGWPGCYAGDVVDGEDSDLSDDE
ncbi:hypothetical protein B0H13DRAFT_892533 [Mycena leptocephala]|nr:hypothetical protein B0H13DRAFT_892533 [Mycena leptocephala]